MPEFARARATQVGSRRARTVVPASVCTLALLVIPKRAPRSGPTWVGVIAAIVAVAVATSFAWTVLGREHLADAVMVYLLATVSIATRFGYGPSLFAAVLSVLAFDVFFVPPYFDFTVVDLRHLVTFAVMFVVAALISGLTQRVRDQAEKQIAIAEEANRARMLVEAERLRNALLSSVSHDLRTPLAVVTGAASTLLEGPLEAAVQRELTETILQEAERLNRLVRNLLDMTRLEAGAVQVDKQWSPVEEVIGSALGRVERLLGDRRVTMEVPTGLPLVPLDPVLVEQVLVNLLENAVKYTPEGTEITVIARELPQPVDAIEIEVADRGPGVPPGEATRVFEKFHRIGERRDGRGTGLGLAICRAIVTAHGGEIRVEPREGGGARFRFRLPVCGNAPTVERSEGAPS
jgi:two-component system, OmpR family, sensor histidine kinase KdpD